MILDAWRYFRQHVFGSRYVLVKSNKTNEEKIRRIFLRRGLYMVRGIEESGLLLFDSDFYIQIKDEGEAYSKWYVSPTRYEWKPYIPFTTEVNGKTKVAPPFPRYTKDD